MHDAALIQRHESLRAGLVEGGLVGTVPNSRAANLRALHLMLDGNPFYTFGIQRVEEAIAHGELDEHRALDVMARACGLPSQEAFLGDWGQIAPEATMQGLVAAARLLARVIRRRGRVAFGTGHPGSMLSFYQALADRLEAQGVGIAHGEVGAPVGIDWYLDYVGDVAVTSDYCGILHGHATRPMEVVLATAGPVDLVVGDHGHAGAAINAGLPCISVMDTNDPALAMAQALEVPDLVVVPFFDNRANAVTSRLAAPFWELVMAVGGGTPRVVFDRDR